MSDTTLGALARHPFRTDTSPEWERIMSEPVVWILVADRSRARVLHALPDRQAPFPTLVSFVHEEGRLQRQEMESDSPGRTYRPGGARSAVEPHEDPEHHEAHKFATQLCDYLDRACLENRFDRLSVIAPPGFLGILRDQWTSRLKSCITQELDKELAGLDDAQLQSRLAEMFTAVPA